MKIIALIISSLFTTINGQEFYRYLNFNEDMWFIAENAFLLNDQDCSQINEIIDTLNKQQNMVLCNGTLMPYNIKIGIVEEYSTSEDYWGYVKPKKYYCKKFHEISNDMFQYFSNGNSCSYLMIVISTKYSYINIIHNDNDIFDPLSKYFFDNTIMPIIIEHNYVMNKVRFITKKIVDKLVRSAFRYRILDTHFE